MRIDIEIEYKKGKISYSINEENGQYSASGWLTVHTGSGVIDYEVPGEQIYSSSDEAESHVIEKAKNHLDYLISIGAYTPVI